MKPLPFLSNRMRRVISWHGIVYTFFVISENEYHEPVVSGEVKIKGIYHEQNGYEKRNVQEGAVTRPYPSPMILCMCEDAAAVGIGSRVDFNGRYFIVTAKNDVQNYGIACDISLKEVEAWQDQE